MYTILSLYIDVKNKERNPSNSIRACFVVSRTAVILTKKLVD